MTDIVVDEIETQIGKVFALSGPNGVVAIGFDETWARKEDIVKKRFKDARIIAARTPTAIGRQLRAYFDGDLGALDGVKVDAGGTPFQRRVWDELRKIPVGVTTSYGELAKKLGKPGASRAVGLANGRNPVAVVVPCHRVIGHDGTLTGYASGVERKAWLLRHEGALL